MRLLLSENSCAYITCSEENEDDRDCYSQQAELFKLLAHAVF